MFLAIVFIVLGVILLLNAFGIIVTANFWTLFWAIVLLAVGLGMLRKKGKCPMCSWGKWHAKCDDKCDEECCGHNHEEDHN